MYCMQNTSFPNHIKSDVIVLETTTIADSMLQHSDKLTQAQHIFMFQVK